MVGQTGEKKEGEDALRRQSKRPVPDLPRPSPSPPQPFSLSTLLPPLLCWVVCGRKKEGKEARGNYIRGTQWRLLPYYLPLPLLGRRKRAENGAHSSKKLGNEGAAEVLFQKKGRSSNISNLP